MNNTEHKYLSHSYKPICVEINRQKLATSGNIPPKLKGVFLRNGPNPHYIPERHYHLFDGDGMLHGLYFNQGEVYYTNKWVRTEKWKMEAKFGKAIFGGLLDYQQNKLKFSMINKAFNTSNTNLIFHHGKLHSLWEFGHPYEINPYSLETIGVSAISKNINGAFTAHPKIDPISGEMYGLSYNGALDLPACTLHIFDIFGNLKESRNFIVPYRSMIHDFAYTKNHFIIPLFPAIVDFSGKSDRIVKWQPEKDAYIGLANKKNKEEAIIWFKLKPCYVYHFINAYENGQIIILDAIIHDQVPLFSLNQFGDPIDPKHAQLVRWQFNLDKKTFAQIPLDRSNLYYHFPIYDTRLAGKKYRYIFASAEESVYKLIRFDLKTYEKRFYCAEENTILSEPIIVPLNPNIEESLGYLICLASSYIKNETKLLLFDSINIERPLASAILPHYIPIGFHGLWIPDII